MKITRLEGEGAGYILSHDENDCSSPCALHHRTKHHMRKWPQCYRSDRYLMERICPHGIGHPDPDHIGYLKKIKSVKFVKIESVHGCDGCCAKPAMTDKRVKYEEILTKHGNGLNAIHYVDGEIADDVPADGGWDMIPGFRKGRVMEIWGGPVLVETSDGRVFADHDIWGV